ncbi:hypothetical protein GCM10027299_29580 [Larkinella ripae]
MSNEEKEIRQVFDAMAAAWDKGDAEWFSSYFTEDCDYVTFAGDHLVGRKAIADAHETLLHGILRGSRLKGSIKKIRFLTADVAVVHGVGVVQLRWQKTAPKGRESINTTVFVRQNGEWKATAFHNCRIQKPGFFQKLFMKLLS